MGKIIFISGGVRSGKSGFAVELAKKLSGSVAFIATARPLDPEMEERIAKHKAGRPGHWEVMEEDKNIHLLIPGLSGKVGAVIIDCLGLLISNLLSAGLDNAEIEERIEALVGAMKKSGPVFILVSNETGMGIVPDNALARRFRDLLGSANKLLAGSADEVSIMFSGIPLRIKGGGFEGKTEENAV